MTTPIEDYYPTFRAFLTGERVTFTNTDGTAYASDIVTELARNAVLETFKPTGIKTVQPTLKLDYLVPQEGEPDKFLKLIIHNLPGERYPYTRVGLEETTVTVENDETRVKSRPIVAFYTDDNSVVPVRLPRELLDAHELYKAKWGIDLETAVHDRLVDMAYMAYLPMKDEGLNYAEAYLRLLRAGFPQAQAIKTLELGTDMLKVQDYLLDREVTKLKKFTEGQPTEIYSVNEEWADDAPLIVSEMIEFKGEPTVYESLLTFWPGKKLTAQINADGTPELVEILDVQDNSFHCADNPDCYMVATRTGN